MKRDEFYISVLKWSRSFLKKDNTLLIGINGPQGCGKSTLCENLVELSKKEGIHAATLSIDDFYLTRADQIIISKEYSSNPYLQQRGYPGTHDVELGTLILTKIKKLKKLGEVSAPTYVKSAHQGQGDRNPESKYKKITGPLDILFFEGWMLGFPITESNIPDPNLSQINGFLKSYENWNILLDAFLFLAPDKIENVLSWRVEAEENRKKTGASGMTKSEIEAYVRKFLPAYELYLPELKKKLENFSNSKVIKIGLNRLPVS